MMVECKAMDIELNDAVLAQLLRYHIQSAGQIPGDHQWKTKFWFQESERATPGNG